MNPIDLPRDAVTLKDGHPVTTSLRVAEIFKKDHAKVLRDIRNLLAQVPEKFGQANFGLSEYINAQGRPQPMYELTRSGFDLLVMGFTGQEAVAYKVAYIERFNAMEGELLQQRNYALAVPPRMTLPQYHETLGGLTAIQAEVDHLFSALREAVIECSADEIDDLSSRRLQVGKKVHLVRDLVGVLEECGISRKVAKDLTGHDSNAIRQFAHKARSAKTHGVAEEGHSHGSAH